MFFFLVIVIFSGVGEERLACSYKGGEIRSRGGPDDES